MMINQNLNSKSHFSMLRNFSSCSFLCLFSFFTHSAILGEELFITIVSFTCTISLQFNLIAKIQLKSGFTKHFKCFFNYNLNILIKRRSVSENLGVIFFYFYSIRQRDFLDVPICRKIRIPVLGVGIFIKRNDCIPIRCRTDITTRI